MPRYKLIPQNDPRLAIDFVGKDAAAALSIASTRKFPEADVYEGERYLFTLQRSGPINACWTIITKPKVDGWRHSGGHS